MSADEAVANDVDGLGLSPRELELVRSAYRVVVRQGGHRVSLQDIADDAGVSKGLLLYHFKTKDNLLLAMMRWALVRTAERIRDNIATTDEPVAALRAVLDAVWVRPQANRDFYLLYVDLVEHAARVPQFGDLPAMTVEIIEGMYAEVIAQGAEAGAFDVADVAQAATEMRAFIEGLFILWLQRDDWESSHAAMRERCEAGLLRLLGAA